MSLHTASRSRQKDIPHGTASCPRRKKTKGGSASKFFKVTNAIHIKSSKISLSVCKKENLPCVGMARNLEGRKLPYAAVMQTSGLSALKSARKPSCMNEPPSLCWSTNCLAEVFQAESHGKVSRHV
jgi:hypothetical protein